MVRGCTERHFSPCHIATVSRWLYQRMSVKYAIREETTVSSSTRRNRVHQRHPYPTPNHDCAWYKKDAASLSLCTCTVLRALRKDECAFAASWNVMSSQNFCEGLHLYNVDHCERSQDPNGKSIVCHAFSLMSRGITAIPKAYLQQRNIVTTTRASRVSILVGNMVSIPERTSLIRQQCNDCCQQHALQCNRTNPVDSRWCTQSESSPKTRISQD